MSKSYTFDVYSSGDAAAGLSGYTEKVTVVLDSGSPFGEPGEFEEHLRSSLADWFDGATVSLARGRSQREQEVIDMVLSGLKSQAIGPGSSMPVSTVRLEVTTEGVSSAELLAALDAGAQSGMWVVRPGGPAGLGVLVLTDQGYAQSRI